MRSMEQSSKVVGGQGDQDGNKEFYYCMPQEATMERLHHLDGIHKHRLTHFRMNPFPFAVTSQKVRGGGHRTAMFAKRVSPKRYNSRHMSPGSGGMVPALDGTQRQKQKVQSFASLLAGFVAPGDSPSRECLRILGVQQPLQTDEPQR